MRDRKKFDWAFPDNNNNKEDDMKNEINLNFKNHDDIFNIEINN